uniref:DUF1725 domain-containing protein n=1 Tax=Sus scrofa TaxID=9823 RepID=A0A8W4FC42_PIG
MQALPVWSQSYPLAFLGAPSLNHSFSIFKNLPFPMFFAALYTIAKTWKQPKCSSTEEWIKKMWYIYTMEYYSAIKRKEMMAYAATWMDLEIIMLNEVSQTVRHKRHMLPLTCGI